VIYVRFSSELQRLDSNVDQERRCREYLTSMGIAHGHFIVLGDEAISGYAFQKMKRAERQNYSKNSART